MKKIGVFHPTLNGCGGAEWVALNIVNILKKEKNLVSILTNERVNQEKISSVFGQKAHVDRNYILPLEFFPPTDLHNVYTDGVRTIYLSKICDLVIDTHSNAILPGVNITYIHYPLFGRLNLNYLKSIRSKFYIPYYYYELKTIKNTRRMILCNSKYTSNAIKRISGIHAKVLYPPISKSFYINPNDLNERENLVVALSRISAEKKLHLIPYISKMTKDNTKYLIIGIKQSNAEYERILNTIDRLGVNHKVEVITDMPKKELQIVLKKAKIYLHTARGEHFGVSIGEAMASGCIPIVHNSGGPMEYLPRSYRFNDYTEAAIKIQKNIKNWSPEKVREIVGLAKKFSEDNFKAYFLKYYYDYLLKIENDS